MIHFPCKLLVRWNGLSTRAVDIDTIWRICMIMQLHFKNFIIDYHKSTLLSQHCGRVLGFSMHRPENHWPGICSVPASDITNAELIKIPPTVTIHILLSTGCNKTNFNAGWDNRLYTQYSKLDKLLGVTAYVLSGLSISLGIIMETRARTMTVGNVPWKK